MFPKIWTSSVLVLALCLQVAAHAVVSPPLGVKGTPKRADAQQPSQGSPCGPDVKNITSAIDSSTTVLADATGSFQVNATSFNGGVDGSLMFTAQIDASGTGTKFVSMKITTNGNNSPPGAGSQMLVASLPAGTKCTGGATGTLCLAQFISGGKFGNCVAVSQGIVDAGTPNSTDHGSSATVKAAGHCPVKSTASIAGATGATVAVTPRAGSLMARSLLADIWNLRDGAVEIAQ